VGEPVRVKLAACPPRPVFATSLKLGIFFWGPRSRGAVIWDVSDEANGEVGGLRGDCFFRDHAHGGRGACGGEVSGTSLEFEKPLNGFSHPLVLFWVYRASRCANCYAGPEVF